MNRSQRPQKSTSRRNPPAAPRKKVQTGGAKAIRKPGIRSTKRGY